jgi:hypothetical protein
VSIAGGIITVRVSGPLKQPDWAAALRSAGALIGQHSNKVRILVIMEDFHGIVRGGDWGDVSFQVENDDLIEKIAIVGEKRWEDFAILFAGKGLRRFPVEYFQPSEMAKALDWVAQEE